MQIFTPEQVYNTIHKGGFSLKHLKTMAVSEHFTWAEVFTSRTMSEVLRAERRIFDNALGQAGLLEKVRTHLSQKAGQDVALTVTSWYRSTAINSQISGAAKASRHLLAQATDFTADGIDPKRVQAWLIEAKDTIGYCLEITNGNWTHVDNRQSRIVFENLGGGKYRTLSVAQMQAFIRKHGRAA